MISFFHFPHTSERHVPQDESGSSIVQSVMVIFPVIILAIAVVEFAVFNYEAASLSSQISRVLVTTDIRDLADMRTNGVDNRTIGNVFRDRIRANAPGFTEDMTDEDFWVDNFEITVEKKKETVTNQNPKDPKTPEGSVFGEITDANASIDITCQIHYKMPSMYGYSVFDQNRILSRNVHLVQTGTSRFEVAQ